MYYLIHDGTLFPIYCDMTAENGVGVTVIGHDSEARTEVDGYEDPQSYRRKIKYEIAMKQIVANHQPISEMQAVHSIWMFKCWSGFWGCLFVLDISTRADNAKLGGAPSNSENVHVEWPAPVEIQSDGATVSERQRLVGRQRVPWR